MEDRCVRGAVWGRREYYEGIVWAIPLRRLWGASVSVVGCSEKELAEGA